MTQSGYEQLLDKLDKKIANVEAAYVKLLEHLEDKKKSIRDNRDKDVLTLVREKTRIMAAYRKEHSK